MYSKRLLIIGFTWPEPKATAAGSRMLQLIHFFLEDSYQITFASTAKQCGDELDWEALGIQTATIALNDSSFDVFIKNLNPTVVVFDRYLTEEQFGWRVAEQVPEALRVLDTEDLHSLRYARKEALKNGAPFHTNQWLLEDITKRELASIYRSDVSLIISSYEMKLLQEVASIPESLLLHLPFMVEKVETAAIESWPSFDKRQHMMFIGTGKHAPNIDCTQYMINTIWPRIRNILPKAELHVYGSYLPEHIQSLHRPHQGFLVKGKADCVSKTMQQYRIQLAPLRFGAGIKGKLLDAMRYGTPSITTSIGAEGMHGNLPWNGYIVNEPMDIVEKSVDLYSKEAKWKKAQQNGVDIVNKLFTKANLLPLLKERIDWLKRDLTLHRTQNVIGGMLRHHTMASTKYMGK